MDASGIIGLIVAVLTAIVAALRAWQALNASGAMPAADPRPPVSGENTGGAGAGAEVAGHKIG